MTRHECHRVHAGVIGPLLNDGRNPMTQNLRHGLRQLTDNTANDLRPAW